MTPWRASSDRGSQERYVNAAGGLATSVVLIPEATFDETFLRGEVPPGLRDPEPGEDPSVTGAFAIEGVPDGDSVVLAAFENDELVRDPDPNIAGTQIVHISLFIFQGVHTESLGEDPDPFSSAPIRFEYHEAGAGAAIVTDSQSTSAGWVFPRAYYDTTRLASHLFAVGGNGGSGPLSSIERIHQ